MKQNFCISFPDKNSLKLCWFLIWTKSKQSLTVLIHCFNGRENCVKTLKGFGGMGCYPCSNKFKAHFLKILLSFFLFHEKTALFKVKPLNCRPLYTNCHEIVNCVLLHSISVGRFNYVLSTKSSLNIGCL